jgi:dinuclear metal center YbgI/SA1388 family protein
MTISSITNILEKIAPLYLQESYDNAGLIVGRKEMTCSGVLVALDATEEVVKEAISTQCNLIVAHHPIVFKGLKQFNEKNYVEKAIMLAIKNDIAIYACHTNLDNVINGVNGVIADRFGLTGQKILQPKTGLIQKLVVFCPIDAFEKVQSALFAAGAGEIGNYSECSFVSEGTGSFTPNEFANPQLGENGVRTNYNEKKIEVIFPLWKQSDVVRAMVEAHPFETVAYEILSLANPHQEFGSGLIGDLPHPMEESEFLGFVKSVFDLTVIRHTSILDKKVQKIAICGGAGSFLTAAAKSVGADVLITSDIKYHEFFDAETKILLIDIGHFESEQFTIDLFYDILSQNFPNFAILKTQVPTNPVHYFLG